MKRIVIFLALICSSPVSAEADWQYVTTGSSGSVYVADVNSIRERAPIDILRPFAVRTMWVKGNHSENSTVKYRTSTALYAFDCSARTIAQLSIVQYNANGSVYSSSSDTTDSHYDYDPVVPDTIGESFLDKACGYFGE